MSLTETIRADLRTRYPTLTRRPEPPKRPDRTTIVLGRDQNRQPAGLPLRSRLEHVFVLGATGAGKSRLLLHYIRQCINMGEGALFIDPHGNHPGSGYSVLVEWLATQNRRVHIFDFNASSHTIGFNPLACPPGTDVSVVAGNNLDALAVSWEGESFAQKPTIERNLTVAFSALSELGLTFVEAPMLFDHKDEHGLRSFAIQKVKDRYTRDELKRLHELAQDGRRKRDWDQEVVGPLNRLQRLLRPQAIRLMLGQRRPVLDMQAAMDNGDIILANLSGGTRVYERDADLFGRLLVRNALFHAKRRENDNPFTVLLDEAHRFLSSDIPTLLAEVRKYGVSMVAGMQWLQQAETEDNKILAALLNGTNAKVLFRVRDAEESERLAHTTVPVDLEVPVARTNKPAVIGYRRIRLESESESTQESRSASVASTKGETLGRAQTLGETRTTSTGSFTSDGETHSTSAMHASAHGKSSSSGEGASAGEIMVPTGEYWSPLSTSAETAGENHSASHGHSASSSDAAGHSSGHVTSSGSMESESYAVSNAISKSRATTRAETKGESHTLGTGKTKGFSEGLEPILQWLPSSVHSKDNMLYKAGQMLRSLPTGVAYLSYVGQAGAVSTLLTVPPIFISPNDPAKFARIRDELIAKGDAAIPIQVAVSNIERREDFLRGRKEPVKPRAKKEKVIDTPEEKGTWG